MDQLLAGDSFMDFLPNMGENGDPDCIDGFPVDPDSDGFDMEKDHFEAVREAYDVYFSEPRW